MSPSADVSPTSKPISAPVDEGSSAPAVKFVDPTFQLPDAAQDARRTSIQFQPSAAVAGKPNLGRIGSIKSNRRMSSPPPPPSFRSRVSFDTFEKLDKKDELGSEPPSFTLNQKHKDYEYSKRSRTFLCGLDSNDYSEYALEWLIDELVDDGDEIVCLRVVDPEIAKTSLPATKYREEAEEIMKNMEGKNHENKAVNFILEFTIAYNKSAELMIQQIEFYEPAILIVGTRGRSLGGFQGLLPGSVSKFCLQNSPVPVIVVRPNMQRARGKRKRAQDPTRRGYKDILDKAGIDGHLLDASNRNSTDKLGGQMEERHASDDEGAAVLKAVGVKLEHVARGSPLVRVESAATDVTSATNPDSEDGVRLMKSPEIQALESPELSGESAFGDDDTEGPISPDLKPPSLIIRRATGELDTDEPSPDAIDTERAVPEGVPLSPNPPPPEAESVYTSADENAQPS
ncbi:adenine nucleotide alpha hydrolases-like protein [Venturia nashicola]|uniref:Adenine nucleotide alpha hydrolases-like protein n=1 Tax=Venturia nashicola TaxID=86259 RepID=A0A4Z1PQH1_9PEZI|nr:adenine nucleotide alpha hydrolases-like protein [Venturia nashicola]TLD37443.1 adenine nucleotide alpha hydrolases-like protein [Venturia nashicola]